MGMVWNMETSFFHGFPCIWISGQLLKYRLLTAGFKAILQFSSPSSVNQSSVNNVWIPKKGRLLSERPIFIFLSKMLDPESLSFHQEALLMAFPFESSATVSRVLKRLELTPTHLPTNITALPPTIPDETLSVRKLSQINTRPLISSHSWPTASQPYKNGYCLGWTEPNHSLCKLKNNVQLEDHMAFKFKGFFWGLTQSPYFSD